MSDKDINVTIGGNSVNVKTETNTISSILQAGVTTGGTGKVKISSDDDLGNYLEFKLLASTGITLTKGNTGAIETLTIANADSGTLASHIANLSNPHQVTKTQVGLGNADNTSDLNKPVSSATQAALDLKVPYTGATSNIDIGTHDILLNGALVAQETNTVSVQVANRELLNSREDIVIDWDNSQLGGNWSSTGAFSATNLSGTNTGDQTGDGTTITGTGTVADPFVAVAADTNDKVKYNVDDPTAGYLTDKVIAGSGISLTEGTGADESKMVITNDVSVGGSDTYIQYNDNGSFGGLSYFRTNVDEFGDYGLIIDGGKSIEFVTGEFPTDQRTTVNGKGIYIGAFDKDYSAIPTDAIALESETDFADPLNLSLVMYPTIPYPTNNISNFIIRDMVMKFEDTLGILDGAIQFTVTRASIDKLSNFTTNGFLKTSADDGTISIDTNTYLTEEIDPVYSGSEAANITATDITNLENLSGTNTGDQDLTEISKRQINVTFDGQGTAPTTNTKAVVRIPFDCTIVGWKIFGDVSGSAVIGVWKDTYANYPPTSGDSIAGTEEPTLSSVIKNEDTNLTTWTTSLTEGDILVFNVDSASTLTKIYVSLILTI